VFIARRLIMPAHSANPVILAACGDALLMT
jgi:hypothetical protein